MPINLTFRILLFSSTLFTTRAVSQEDFWIPTAGPYGGHLNAVARAPGGVVFAATDGLAYISTDRGISWQPAGQSPFGVTAVEVQYDTCLFIGTSEGVYRSTNNGDTWAFKGLPDFVILSFAFTQNGYVFAGTDGFAIRRSTNNGLGWLGIGAGLGSLVITSLSVNSQDHLFAGTPVGLYRSTNYGDLWEDVLVIPDVEDVLVTLDQSLIAVAADTLYKSTDNGSSWNAITFSPNTLTALASDSLQRVYAGSRVGEVFLSTDNGDSWTRVDSLESVLSSSINSLETDSLGVVYIGTEESGFYRSDSFGESAERSNTGLSQTEVTAVTTDPLGVIYATTPNEGVQYSTDGGSSWEQTALSDQGLSVIVADSFGRVFAGAGYYYAPGKIFLSSDKGLSWTEIFSNTQSVRAIAVNSNAHIFAGLTGVGVYRSTDGGMSWEVINSGLTNTNIYSLAVSPNGNVFVGTNSGIFLSTDNDDQWTYRSPVADFINEIVIDGDGDIFAGVSHDEGSSGVYRSTNDGTVWLNVGLANYAVASLAVKDDNLFAYAIDLGPNSGVYRSTTGGGAWEQVNSGLPTLDCWGFAIDSTGHAYVATFGAGVYRNSDGVTTVYGVSNPVPQVPFLHQNYPNPFNPSTTIRFSVPRSAEVSLRVFNLLGEEVATLVSGDREAGTHTVAWDATGQPSGVYFYRLQVGDYMETKKLMLLR